MNWVERYGWATDGAFRRTAVRLLRLHADMMQQPAAITPLTLAAVLVRNEAAAKVREVADSIDSDNNIESAEHLLWIREREVIAHARRLLADPTTAKLISSLDESCLRHRLDALDRAEEALHNECRQVAIGRLNDPAAKVPE